MCRTLPHVIYSKIRFLDPSLGIDIVGRFNLENLSPTVEKFQLNDLEFTKVD